MMRLLAKRRIMSLIVSAAMMFSCVPISAAEHNVHDGEELALSSNYEQATGGVVSPGDESDVDGTIPPAEEADSDGAILPGSPQIYSIVAFAELEDGVKARTVAFGTALEALTLPDTLAATVMKDGAETETAIDVEWESSPEYAAAKVGSFEAIPVGIYIFTPKLPEDFVLADGVSLPIITVELLPMAIMATDDAWNGGMQPGQTISGGTITVTGEVTVTGKLTISGSVTITGSGTLKRGVGASGALITVPDGAELTLNNVTVDGNKKNYPDAGGSLVYIAPGGTFNMNGGKITGNATNSYGGGVYNGGKFNMTDGEISGNEAPGFPNRGGGVYVNTSSTFTMTGGEILNNTASYGGGVHASNNSTFTMNGGTISGNTASYGAGGSGGGVDSYGVFTMNGGEISGNTGGIGGGVHVSGSTFTMNGGEISANKAKNTTYGGGGVLLDVSSVFNMTGGEISGNTSSAGGGVNIAVPSSTFTMNGGTISGNESYSGGGGVYNSGKFNMTNGEVSGNAAHFGGGVFNDGVNGGGTFRMDGGTISGNTAKIDGGGVYSVTSFTMTGGEISGNKDEYPGYGYGSGVYNEGTFNISGSPKIVNNIKGEDGAQDTGGVYLSNSSSVTITGALTSGASIGIEDTAPSNGAGTIIATGAVARDLQCFYISNADKKIGPHSGFVLSGTSILLGGVQEIYIKSNGSDTSGIGTEDNPFATVGRAYGAISAAGEIIVMDTITASAAITFSGGKTVTLKGYDSGTQMIKRGATGRLITVGDGVTLVLEDLVLDGNKGSYPDSGGSLVHVEPGGTFNMNGGKITGNATNSYGGGVYNGGKFNMTDGEISGNEATGFPNRGGGVYVRDGCTFTMTGGEILNNTASYGGGVHASNNSTFTMNGGTISGNTASYGTGGSGGGVDSYGAFTMNDGEISGNTGGIGGGVHVSGSTFTMNGGEISANKAKNTTYGGGGVLLDVSSVFNMNGGEISGNTSSAGGGVNIAVPSSTFNMTGGTISGNESYSGGGVHNSGKFNMTNGEVSGNAAHFGGGVYSVTSFTMTGGEISDNTAKNGGGIFTSNEAYSNLDIGSAARFRGNTADGAPRVYDNTPDITNYIKTTSSSYPGMHPLNNHDINYSGGVETIFVTGVTLDKTTVTLAAGETERLAETVTPPEASNQTVTWTSGNTGVATVSGGLVTAIAPGSTVITVTTKDGGFTASCNVTVGNSVIAVESVSLNKSSTSMNSGSTETLMATVLPANATNKDVTWHSSDEKTATVNSIGVVTAVKKGEATVTVTTKDGGKIAECVVTVEDIMPTVISVTPSHSVLTNAYPEKEISAIISPSGAVTDAITWEVSPENALIFKGGKKNGQTVTVVKGGYTGGAVVTAKIGDKYTSSATVEILGENITADSYAVNVLSSRVTLNKNKYGVLIPINIDKNISQTNAAMRFAAFGAGSVENTSLIEYISVSDSGFEATPVSDRYFLLSAKDSTAKKTHKKIVFTFHFAGGVSIPGNSAIDVAVIEKYPQITVTADPLDLFYPDRTAKLTVTSDDGECKNIKIASIAAGNGTVTLDENGRLKLGTVTKTGSVKGGISLEIDGYKNAYKTEPKFTVKITETKPKLKLAESAITLNGDAPATLRLLSGDASRSLESFNITDITGNGVVQGSYADGYFKVAKLPQGKATLQIQFADTKKTFPLTLTVKTATVKNPKISAKIKSVAVSKNHIGLITAIDIASNPSNLDLSGMTVDDTNAPGITATLIEKRIYLSTDGTALKNGKIEVSMSINGTVKKIVIKVIVQTKAAKATISLKGKIDVAVPGSKINGTVKLANTISDLDDVILDGNDFTANNTGGNTFEIISVNPSLAPGIEKSVNATIVLKNGERLPAVTLKITPSQTVSNAWQSKKEILLPKALAYSGEEISLGFFNAGVTLGEVQINKKSVEENDDFILTRNGANSVTLQLDPDKTESQLNVKSNKTYTVKLELWAEGTYERNSSGEAMRDADSGQLKPLGKAKPALVSVKINMK